MRKKINGMVVLALMVTAGCSSEKAATTASESADKAVAPLVASSPTPAPLIPKAPAPILSPITAPTPTGYGFDQWQRGSLGDVFFDFDRSSLRADDQERLKQNAAWLASNTGKRALIEGHCDSRGTSEYNLALGERRASSAKEYLVRLGVAPTRLETVSFGEERPFDTGQGEAAWAKNRRAHFIVK